MLTDIGLLHGEAGDRDRALAALQRSLAVREKALGPGAGLEEEAGDVAQWLKER